MPVLPEDFQGEELPEEYKSEQLPSGMFTYKSFFAEGFQVLTNGVMSTGIQTLALSKEDIERLYEITHPKNL